VIVSSQRDSVPNVTPGRTLVDLAWDSYILATKGGDRTAISSAYAVYREALIAHSNMIARVVPVIDWNCPTRGRR
jgi:hypothetical protein